MNKDALNKIFHTRPSITVTGEVGERVPVELPKLPMTGATEFVQIEPDLQGVRHIVATSPIKSGPSRDGRMGGGRILLKLAHPGEGEIDVFLLDRTTGRRIDGVDPFRIKVVAKEAAL
jgi:hypothetical protein